MHILEGELEALVRYSRLSARLFGFGFGLTELNAQHYIYSFKKRMTLNVV